MGVCVCLGEWWACLEVGRCGRGTRATHFWNTKMPTIRVKEIRSAVTHMRQYSSGGCEQKDSPGLEMAWGLRVVSEHGELRVWRCVYSCVHRIKDVGRAREAALQVGDLPFPV